MISIEFDEIFHYRPTSRINEVHPVVPVRLTHNDKTQDVLALLDSGATYCIFSCDFAEDLGIDLHSGILKNMTSLGGRFQGYLHTINLEINGYKFNDCDVIFSLNPISRNILGRSSFFDKIKIGFAEKCGEIYFSADPVR